jgi:hypothetical protein
METNMRLALKAQAQSARTVEILAAINPPNCLCQASQHRTRAPADKQQPIPLRTRGKQLIQKTNY